MTENPDLPVGVAAGTLVFIVRSLCITAGLAWLLFVWRLWLHDDDRWMTTLIGGPTTLFVGLVGVALVVEGWLSGRWRGATPALVACLAILGSVLL